MLEQEEDWYIFVRLLYNHICIVATVTKLIRIDFIKFKEIKKKKFITKFYS